MSEQDHRRDQARVMRAAGRGSNRVDGRHGPQPLVAVPRSNVAVERPSLEEEGIRRAPVRCRACNGRSFDLLGVPADVRSLGAAPFASLWIARRCLCRRTSAGRVAVQPGVPPPLGLVGSWRCARGHFLADVDPASGRVRVPCRKCHLELSVVPADAMVAALIDDLARAS